jgi:hypothetical protein
MVLTLTLVLLTSLLANVFLVYRNVRTRLEIEFALEQITTFRNVSSQVESGRISSDEGREYILGYYPAGTKLQESSSLSRLVEEVREIAVNVLDGKPAGRDRPRVDE